MIPTKHIESETDLGVAVGQWKRRKDTEAQKVMKAAERRSTCATYQETVFGRKVENLPENVRFLERKGQEITPGGRGSGPGAQEPVRPAWFESAPQALRVDPASNPAAGPGRGLWPGPGNTSRPREYQAKWPSPGTNCGPTWPG